MATSVETTDWARIVVLYETLGRVAPNPVVEVNRAVAVAQASGAAAALALLDSLDTAALNGSHLVPSVRGQAFSEGPP